MHNSYLLRFLHTKWRQQSIWRSSLCGVSESKRGCTGALDREKQSRNPDGGGAEASTGAKKANRALIIPGKKKALSVMPIRGISGSAFFFRYYSGNATAFLYSSFRRSMNARRDSRRSSLWVQRTQEKLSLQSKGIQANWPL